MENKIKIKKERLKELKKDLLKLRKLLCEQEFTFVLDENSITKIEKVFKEVGFEKIPVNIHYEFYPFYDKRTDYDDKIFIHILEILEKAAKEKIIKLIEV